MKNNHILFSSSYIVSGLLLFSLITCVTAWPQEVYAHANHAGTKVTYMKKKVTLKEMLPENAKLAKRKQRLSKDAVDWAKENFGIELDGDIYSYYLARDKDSKKVIGAAIISKMKYRHGNVTFAVGVNAEQRVTKVAIMAINEKYVVDFEGNVGTGLIPAYAGGSLTEIIAKAKNLETSDKATREFANAVRDISVLLAAFMYSAQ